MSNTSQEMMKMTVEKVGLVLTTPRNEWQGLSTDAKPANANPGDTFLELDTAKRFTYGNGQWHAT